MDLWSKFEIEKRVDLKPSFIEKIKTLDGFIEISKLIENKDARKLQRFLELKKFFSFPWIIANEILFSKRDFYTYIYKPKNKD